MEIAVKRRLSAELMAPSNLRPSVLPMQHVLRPDRPLAGYHTPAAPKHTDLRCPFRIESCPGCLGPPNNDGDDSRSVELKLRPNNTEILRSLQVQSPTAYRQQLIVNFYDAHFPRGISTRFIVLDKIIDWSKPRSAAMAAALDCLLLIQLGIGSGNVAALLESKKRHHAAVLLTRKAIEKPNAYQDDGLIAAVDALGICEIFTESSDGHGAWRMHSRGMTALLKARGSRVLRRRFPSNVFIDGLPSALIDAILSRKALVFANPDWQSEMGRQYKSRFPRLLALGCHIPGLLERLDELRLQGQSNESILQLLEEFGELDEKLNTWLLDWYRSQPADRQPFRMTSVTNFPDFVAQFGTASGTFPKAQVFPTLLSAVAHSFYWTLLMIIRTAAYDATTLLPRHMKHYARPDVRMSAADGCASSICQSVPFLLATRNPTVMGSRVVCGPLQFAQSWYERKGDKMRMDWCEQVTKKLSRQLSAQLHWAFMQKIVCLPRGLVGWLTMAM